MFTCAGSEVTTVLAEKIHAEIKSLHGPIHLSKKLGLGKIKRQQKSNEKTLDRLIKNSFEKFKGTRRKWDLPNS